MASKQNARQGDRWHLLPWRNPRDPLTLTIRYRGGAEAWYEIRARGSVGRIEGHICLHDVMMAINCWDKYVGPRRQSSADASKGPSSP